MATLIRRSEALKRINKLEERATEIGDKKGAEWIVKCFNAIMSCKVEERFFCSGCGKPVKLAQVPEDDQTGGALSGILPGQMTVEDFM